MFRLDSKVAVVTGGTSGIGAETARWLVRAGARVVIAGRRVDRGETVAAELGSLGSYLRTDITREDDVARLMEEVVRRWERVDVLVTSAGTINRIPVPDLSLDQWSRVLDVNLTGVFLTCKHAIRIMRRQRAGSIINIASYLGFRGGINTPAYNASKAGVIALTRSMAVQHGPEGIRVNAICPGFIPTELNRDRWEGAPAERLQQLVAGYPLGRLGTPADVAAAAVFLASDEASWITGACLPVEGGLTAR